MIDPATVLFPVELATAIARHPLNLTPTANGSDAIAQMFLDGTTCELVLEDDRLVGMVTALDLVRLSAAGQNPVEQAIANIMSAPVCILNLTDFTDVFVPLGLLQRHQIHHLPVVDDAGTIVGLLTHDSLQPLFPSLDLLHLTPAAEVMAQTVIQAASTATLAELTQIMAAHGVHSVVIVETRSQDQPLQNPEAPNPMPVGIVTDRDVVQWLSLELNFATIQVETVMNAPIVAMASGCSLWDIQQLMQTQQTTQVVMTDDNGCLVGIVTQPLVLNQLNPMAIYGIVERLMQARLKAKQPTQTRLAELPQEGQSRSAKEVAAEDDDNDLEQTHEKLQRTLEELQVAEEELRGQNLQLAEERLKYLDLFDFAPDGYLVTNTRGIIQSANRAIAVQFAVSQPFLVGKPLALFIARSHRSGFYTQLNQLAHQNQKQTWDITFQPQQGNTFPAEVTVVPMPDNSGNGTSLRWLIRDISRRVQIEAERKRAENALQNLIEGTAATTGENFFPALVSHIAEALQVSYALVTEQVDDTLHALAFWANGALQPTFFYHPAKTPCERTLQNGKFYCEALVQQQFPDDLDLVNMGAESYLGIALYDTQGNPIGNLCILNQQPISDPEWAENLLRVFAARAAAELERERAIRALERLNEELENQVAERTAALRTSEERWQLALKGTNDGIWDWDLTNNKIFFSSRWKQMRGFTDDEIGDSPDECLSRMHPEDYDRVMAAVDDHFSGKTEFFEVEYRTQRKDGSYMWVLDRAQALHDESGQVIRMSGSETEITQRKLAETALRDSERRYATLATVAPVAIFQFDEPLNCTYVNDRWSEMTGRPKESALGRGWVEALHPDDRDRMLAQWTENYAQCDSSQQILNHGEGRHLRPDGSINWYYIQVAKEIDATGQVIGYIGTLTDITDRKQTELALQESQRFIQQISEASPNILYLYDIQEQRNVYSNREIATTLGYTPAEIRAMGSNLFQNLIHPDDLDRLSRYQAQIYAAQDGEIFEFEYRMRHANGEWRWLYSRDSVFSRDARGQAKQTIGAAQDITERKRLEQEQNRLIAILEASTDYISMSDLAGNIIWNNTALRQICGLESEAAVRQRHIIDYHPQWATDLILQQGLPTAIAHGSWISETALLDAEGQEIPLSQLILVHKSPRGEVEFISTIARDRRVHKAYEQQLERTNAELLRATRLKDEFLANMSHELRTPLNAILGMSEGLQENTFGGLNDRQQKAIATIERSGQHLLGLINDILELSKIEAGKLELNITSTSVAQLCRSSLDFVKQQAFKKQIQLKVTLPPEPREIALDERRMRQVLINLLTNAVKFTPSGGQISLEVYLEPIEVNLAERISLFRSHTAQLFQDDPQAACDPLEDYYFCIAVTDTGIGIAAADQAKLFQPFIQIDSKLNRQYEGTGLGLALLKRIVELHGGEINLHSKLGQGSCFTVRLPARCQIANQPAASLVHLAPQTFIPTAIAASELPAESTIAPQPLILLAEDNAANISTFSDYLSAKGYRILVAKNGREAIRLTQTHQPDLILMDIQMPEMDGLEAIQTIHQDPQLAQIPIIALTALAMQGDRQKCLAAGATEYLAKPVRLKDLNQTIQTLLARQSRDL
ncbi:MAG: PAS domain S-box protein [Scytolyngbya sp. HA4215-MV1]|jgi:PAS domain S-box-containing protein|nr:PAS domain S-box protein [Scytolyngbya sp. HA4215-MV1]